MTRAGRPLIATGADEPNGPVQGIGRAAAGPGRGAPRPARWRAEYPCLDGQRADRTRTDIHANRRRCARLASAAWSLAATKAGRRPGA
jgi:hypothetical protein